MLLIAIVVGLLHNTMVCLQKNQNLQLNRWRHLPHKLVLGEKQDSHIMRSALRRTFQF